MARVGALWRDGTPPCSQRPEVCISQVPQEYGVTETEKRRIAVRICRNLVSKILKDIELATGRGNSDLAEQLYQYEAGGKEVARKGWNRGRGWWW